MSAGLLRKRGELLRNSEAEDEQTSPRLAAIRMHAGNLLILMAERIEAVETDGEEVSLVAVCLNGSRSASDILHGAMTRLSKEVQPHGYTTREDQYLDQITGRLFDRLTICPNDGGAAPMQAAAINPKSRPDYTFVADLAKQSRPYYSAADS